MQATSNTHFSRRPKTNTLEGEEVSTKPRGQSRQSQESDWVGSEPKTRPKSPFVNVLTGEELNPTKYKVRGPSRQNEQSLQTSDTPRARSQSRQNERNYF